MSLAARFDAKAPDIAFAGDSQAKQREASEPIRALAERRLGAAYRQLESLAAAIFAELPGLPRPASAR